MKIVLKFRSKLQRVEVFEDAKSGGISAEHNCYIVCGKDGVDTIYPMDVIQSIEVHVGDKEESKNG